ncbi:hypothetical protein ABMA58_10265, partial [Oceanospirillum sp. HFRX-1_2]
HHQPSASPFNRCHRILLMLNSHFFLLRVRLKMSLAQRLYRVNEQKKGRLKSLTQVNTAH